MEGIGKDRKREKGDEKRGKGNGKEKKEGRGGNRRWGLISVHILWKVVIRQSESHDQFQNKHVPGYMYFIITYYLIYRCVVSVHVVASSSGWLSIITGLDYWNGLLKWTTGLTFFALKSFLRPIMRFPHL